MALEVDNTLRMNEDDQAALIRKVLLLAKHPALAHLTGVDFIAKFNEETFPVQPAISPADAIALRTETTRNVEEVYDLWRFSENLLSILSVTADASIRANTHRNFFRCAVVVTIAVFLPGGCEPITIHVPRDFASMLELMALIDLSFTRVNLFWPVHYLGALRAFYAAGCAAAVARDRERLGHATPPVERQPIPASLSATELIAAEVKLVTLREQVANSSREEFMKKLRTLGAVMSGEPISATGHVVIKALKESEQWLADATGRPRGAVINNQSLVGSQGNAASAFGGHNPWKGCLDKALPLTTSLCKGELEIIVASQIVSDAILKVPRTDASSAVLRPSAGSTDELSYEHSLTSSGNLLTTTIHPSGWRNKSATFQFAHVMSEAVARRLSTRLRGIFEANVRDAALDHVHDIFNSQMKNDDGVKHARSALKHLTRKTTSGRAQALAQLYVLLPVRVADELLSILDAAVSFESILRENVELNMSPEQLASFWATKTVPVFDIPWRFDGFHTLITAAVLRRVWPRCVKQTTLELAKKLFRFVAGKSGGE